MAAALAIIPPSSRPLYEVEEYLAALAETADMVPAEELEVFEQEFRQALTTAVEKRDRVGQFMAHLETQIDFAKREIARLKDRKDVYERTLERLGHYVGEVIRSLGCDTKGKLRKLEGSTVSFRLQKCPESVEITDQSALPSSYLHANVTLPAQVWEMMLDSLDLEIRAEVLQNIVGKISFDAPKDPIKRALQTGVEVPGAKLLKEKYSLRRE